MSTEQESLEKSLADYLNDYGLDGIFWTKHLQTVGIKKTSQKELVDEASFKKILISAKKEKEVEKWEITRLGKCFSLPEKQYDPEAPDLNSGNDSIETQKKRLDTENEKQNKLSEQKMLQNKDWGMKQSTWSKQETLTAVKAPESNGTIAISRDNQSDIELIKKISAGMVLKGYYLSKDTKTSMECKQTILECPQTVALINPKMPEQQYEYELYSREGVDTLQHGLEHGGHSVAASYGGGGWGFKAEASAGHKEEFSNERQIDMQSTTNFACKTKYHVVPTKAFELNQDNGKLSKTAVNDLRNIETCLDLDKSVVDEKCEMFFDKFGSHFYIGLYHFGGIYQWLATMQSNEKMDKFEALKLCQTALDGGIKAGYSGLGANASGTTHAVKASDIKSKIATESSIVNTRLCKIGGPQEADDFSAWKVGLTSQSDTWHVIDREYKENNYEGVWKLIPNGTQYFENPLGLALAVLEAWESLTGKDNNRDKGLYMNYLDQLIGELTSEHYQCSGDSRNEDRTLCLLRELDKVTDIIEKKFKTDDIWVQKCKKDAKDVLQSINKIKCSPDTLSCLLAGMLLEKATKSSTNIHRIMMKLRHALQRMELVSKGDVDGRKTLQNTMNVEIQQAIKSLFDKDLLQFIFFVASFCDLGDKMLDVSRLSFQHNLSEDNIRVLLKNTDECCKDFIAFDEIVRTGKNTNQIIACLERLVNSLKVITVDMNFSQMCLDYLSKDASTQEFLEVVVMHLSEMTAMEKKTVLDLLMDLVGNEHSIGLRKRETILLLKELIETEHGIGPGKRKTVLSYLQNVAAAYLRADLLSGVEGGPGRLPVRLTMADMIEEIDGVPLRRNSVVGFDVTANGNIILAANDSRSSPFLRLEGGCIYLLSSSVQRLSDLGLRESLRGITVINQTEVATIARRHIIIINIADSKTLSVARRIDFKCDDFNSKITAYNDNMILTHGKTVTKIDMNGKEIWKKNLDKIGRYDHDLKIQHRKDGDRVIVTDCLGKRLTFLSADTGEVLKILEVGGQPGGVTVDSDGRIYVCGMSHGDISVWSADMKEERRLRSGSGVNQPIRSHVIACDRRRNEIFVLRKAEDGCLYSIFRFRIEMQ